MGLFFTFSAPYIWGVKTRECAIYCINNVKVEKKAKNSPKKGLFFTKKLKFLDTVYAGCYTALKLEESRGTALGR